MVTTTSKLPMSGIARRLVRERLISEADAEKAYEHATRTRVPFVSYLVERQLVSARNIAVASAHEFGVPLVDVSALEIDPEVTKLVEEKLVRGHHALPLFKRGNRLFVAMSDPTNLAALDEIKFHAGLNTEALLAEEDKLVRVIDRAMEEAHTALEGLGDADLDALDVTSREDTAADTGKDIDDTPVVRFVNKVLLDGINRGASDIHFEPYEKFYRVRFRQDGQLREVTNPPIALAGKIAARIKVMSRLDIAERRVPQDGRIKLTLSKTRAIDFRVSTCPTLWGEKIVMRILDPSSAKLGIDALGYEPVQKKAYLDALNRPYGMILVTGPTGSGKTVSLYTGLNILNTPDRNISTAEDPAEINLPGVNQVNVNPKVGLTFASALRAFLRQDPDIVMVGEIRDLETAEIAIKAAQTGHLVLSTLHTNDAPQTITRLANMGVPAYNVASALLLIIAQRLARRLCDQCKTKDEVPKNVLLREGFTEQDIAKGLTLYKAVGCDQCNQGYKGRTGIYQVLPISETMQKKILDGANAMELAAQAKAEGINDLRRSGLLKVAAGTISLEELNRVTKD